MDAYYYHCWHSMMYFSQQVFEAHQKYWQAVEATKQDRQVDGSHPSKNQNVISITNQPIQTKIQDKQESASLVNTVERKEGQKNHTFAFRQQKKIVTPSTSATRIIQTNYSMSPKGDRNANSNLLRMFFRHLSHSLSVRPQFIECIIKKNKIRMKAAHFKQWFELNQVQCNRYVKVAACKPLFFGKKTNKACSKIMRILLSHYMRTDAYCHYLTSKKIKKDILGHGFNAMRGIFSEILRARND